MDIKLTQFSHGGGCGCKIAPAVLTELLADTPLRQMPKELIVGTETADDAAVYKLNDEQAIVATTDFFTPIVDDPYDFGRIAATNAISDIYAMGGRPIMALAVVGMPLDKLPQNLEIHRAWIEFFAVPNTSNYIDVVDLYGQRAQQYWPADNVSMSPDGSTVAVQTREGVSQIWMWNWQTNAIALVSSS